MRRGRTHELENVLVGVVDCPRVKDVSGPAGVRPTRRPREASREGVNSLYFTALDYSRTLSFVSMQSQLSFTKRFLYARVHPPTRTPPPPWHPASYHRWRAHARSVSLFFLMYNFI